MSIPLAQIMGWAMLADHPDYAEYLSRLATDELASVDILEEYKRVLQKKSKLSAGQRDEVMMRFHKQYPTRCRVCAEPHGLQVEDAGSERECLRVCEGCYVQCVAELAELN